MIKAVSRLSIAFIAVLVLLSAANRDDLFLISKNLDIFASLYKEVSIHYVEETNSTRLMRKGIDAMLLELDPYTEYIPESEVEAYRLKYISTQFGGIGATTLMKDGRLFVNEVIQDYPAYNAKVLPGDEILRIDSVYVKNKTREEIGTFLRGPKGTEVLLTILRDNAPIKITIKRDEILQKNVPFYGILDGNIGYIKLEKFLENAGAEVRSALVELNKKQPQGIVLDLRNNGGGILQEAVKIVNLFVKKDQLVVTQKGRNPEKSILYKTVADPIAPDIPLVVLINGASASASEIVAGSLQDLDRAVIVGQKSFGKGLVQQTFNLPYNSLVKVTVAKYYTPSGRCIQSLDYANKTVEGDAPKFSTELISTFNTRGGRIVFDGDGLQPDETILQEAASPVAITIMNKGLFFEFANLYKKQNQRIVSARDFKLTDADFNLFLSTIPTDDQSFSASTNKAIEMLKAEVEAQGLSNELNAQITALERKLRHSSRETLLQHKDEIRKLLETQVVSRYYYEKGKFEQAFKYDDALNSSISILKESNKVKDILAGKGDYKKIGNLN